ncbi:MAG: aminopeptidase [Raoultibacter sp.]
MPGPIDHIAFLSQEIGPRPAGTEEEQQAALYITEQMQKEAGLSAEIEDFRSQSNEELPRAICVLVTLVVVITAMIFPVMVIPALILSVLAAAVYCAETFDKPILSRFFMRGVSQNVVSKYEPRYSARSGGGRRRKIIVLAHYDSGKVRAELSSPLLGILPILQKVSLGAMAFIPVFFLIRALFFLHAADGTLIVLNVITVIALLAASIPLILAILHKFASYNDAASSNASGVAALIELARRVGKTRSSESASAAQAVAEPTIHGEEAARASGLVPEGAQLVYEASQMQAPDPSPQTEEERLVSAKAAIAAITGRSVSHTDNFSIADNLVQVKSGAVRNPNRDEVAEAREETRNALTHAPHEMQAQEEVEPEEIAPAALAEIEEQAPAEELVQSNVSPEPFQSASPEVPDWYKKAQENAKKKPVSDSSKVVRSRYATALDAAVAESTKHFSQANNVVNAETEERIKKMRDGIMEVSAPTSARENFEAKRAELAAKKAEEERARRTAADQEEAKPAYMPAERRMPQEETPAAKSEIAPAAPQPEAPIQSAAPESSFTPDIEEPKKEKRGINALIPESSDQADLGSTTAMPPLNVEEFRPVNDASRRQSSEQTPQQTQSEATNETESFEAVEDAEKRAPIELPSISASAPHMAPIDTSKQQRAPLAQAEESKQDAAKSLLNMLPSIDVAGQAASSEEEAQETSATPKQRPQLRNSLPSLSGALNPVEQEEGSDAAAGASSVSSAGSFASSGATGTFAPVGDELLDGVAPEDVYIEDADDSEYEEGFTESGAFAGPGYVEMPKSRARRFFDKFSFRKNKAENEELSAQEWLDVDEDFDAREVGKERGGWESFNAENGSPTENDASRSQQEKGTRRPDDEWEGGAVRSSGNESGAFEGGFEPDESTSILSPAQSGEMEQIHQFRGAGLDTEVWFVALGSELANNGGMQAFLKEHEQDLKGSILINLDALGRGELSYLAKEGFMGKAGASSRLKRYVKKASQSLGMSVEPTSIRWKESAATAAASKGLQAITLVGMDELKPAGFAQADDVLDEIDEETLEANIDFVMELIRGI